MKDYKTLHEKTKRKPVIPYNEWARAHIIKRDKGHLKRYVDFKKPVFPDAIKPDELTHDIKIERFGNIAEHLGFGFVIIVYIEDNPYSMEGEKIIYDKFFKRKFSYFVDVEATKYFQNSERKIYMKGSYYHGFHYFRTREHAEKIASVLFRRFRTEIKEASIYTSNARGIFLNTEMHCTTEIYIHEK